MHAKQNDSGTLETIWSLQRELPKNLDHTRSAKPGQSVRTQSTS
jgi:hypothetical protein